MGLRVDDTDVIDGDLDLRDGAARPAVVAAGVGGLDCGPFANIGTKYGEGAGVDQRDATRRPRSTHRRNIAFLSPFMSTQKGSGLSGRPWRRTLVSSGVGGDGGATG